MAEDNDDSLILITADIVAAHVSNNSIAVGDVPELIQKVHTALEDLGRPAPAPVAVQQPTVPIRNSVKPDYIICLEDGKKLKMLKRYLRSNYDMSPEQYRAKWKLPVDYPMVAPSYSGERRNLALRMGLGRKKAPEPVAQPVVPSTPRRKRRVSGD
jgi:predicted transcriptional regulator